MKKILTQQFMGVIAALCTLMLSITLYAYRSDLKAMDNAITTEKEQRLLESIEIKTALKTNEEDHKKFIESFVTSEDLKKSNDQLIILINRNYNAQVESNQDVKKIFQLLPKN